MACRAVGPETPRTRQLRGKWSGDERRVAPSGLYDPARSRIAELCRVHWILLGKESRLSKLGEL